MRVGAKGMFTCSFHSFDLSSLFVSIALMLTLLQPPSTWQLSLNTWLRKFLNWLEMPPRTWRSSVSPLATCNSLSVVTKSWTPSSAQPSPSVVFCPASTVLCYWRWSKRRRASLSYKWGVSFWKTEAQGPARSWITGRILFAKYPPPFLLISFTACDFSCNVSITRLFFIFYLLFLSCFTTSNFDFKFTGAVMGKWGISW